MATACGILSHMASTFTRLLLHIIFSTKNRANLIAPVIEDELHRYMGGIISNLGCHLLAGGGTSNHVHFLVSMAKDITIIKLLESLKKDSSKWAKTRGPQFRSFYWQEGYGAFSIGESGVPDLKAYIAAQKKHHQTVSFEDEFRQLLRKYNIPFDERFIWG